MSSLSLIPDPSTFFSRCTKEPSPRCALSTSVAAAGSRRRSFVALSISTMVSLHMDYDNTRSSSRSQAMELSRVLDQSLSSSKIESGDISVSRSLPKPLTASDLVEVTSTGPRFRVAYQGLPGAYSESAAAKAYPKCEAVPCEQFETTFEALAQCEHTLTKLAVVKEAVDDTAGAAQFVSINQFRDTAAVASSLASKIYGLDILVHDIQDDSDNITRFLMLAREPIIPKVDRPFKTSVVFSLEEGPGVLFKALAVFAMRNINLTKIESRPQRNKPLRVSDDSMNGSHKYFHYIFYVDFEASMASQNSQNAVRHLQEFAKYMRVLGSYPMDTNEP